MHRMRSFRFLLRLCGGSNWCTQTSSILEALSDQFLAFSDRLTVQVGVGCWQISHQIYTDSWGRTQKVLFASQKYGFLLKKTDWNLIYTRWHNFRLSCQSLRHCDDRFSVQDFWHICRKRSSMLQATSSKYIWSFSTKMTKCSPLPVAAERL